MSKDQSQQPPNANPAARGAARLPADPSYSTKPLEMNPGGNTAPVDSGTRSGSTTNDAASTALGFLGGAQGGSANPNAGAINDQRYNDYVSQFGNPSWTPHDPGTSATSTYTTPSTPNSASGGPQTYAPPAPGNAAPPGNASQTPYGDVTRNVNTSNVPGLVGGDALAGQMHDAQDAAYKNAAGYLDPQWQNQQSAMEAKLANQGVAQNSEAWNKAMDDFGRQKEFAYSQARTGAVQQGNAAQNQLFNQGLMSNNSQFGQNLQSGQFSNAVQAQLAAQGFTQQQIDNLEQQHRFDNSLTMRNQDINELLLQQQNPLQMFNALTNGNNVQSPNFTNAPGSNVAPTDIAGIYNQVLNQQNSVYNAQTGAANSATAGMTGLGGAALIAYAI